MMGTRRAARRRERGLAAAAAAVVVSSGRPTPPQLSASQGRSQEFSHFSASYTSTHSVIFCLERPSALTSLNYHEYHIVVVCIRAKEGA